LVSHPIIIQAKEEERKQKQEEERAKSSEQEAKAKHEERIMTEIETRRKVEEVRFAPNFSQTSHQLTCTQHEISLNLRFPWRGLDLC